MIVFKTFWKIVNKYKFTIILYTMLLIIFGGLNMASDNKSMGFVNSKPDILIVNNDENDGLTKNFIEYFEKNSNLISIKNNESAINDAIFYRDVNYVIYIPKNYRNDVLNGMNPQIDIKSTGDYQASLAELMLSKYIQTQAIYRSSTSNENELIQLINNTLNRQASIEIMSKIDTTAASNMSNYFNFASYSIMAIIIYIICLVMTVFKEKSIHKRTIISSMNYKKHNNQLLLSGFIYSLIVWILFVLLGFVFLKTSLFSLSGLIYILNLLIFSFCCLTLALFISTIINSKDSVTGIVNVVALGSSFLCGAFVPVEFLPSFVLSIAHILPTYWYINSNNILKTIEIINFNTLHSVFVNMLVLIIFSLFFIILNNIFAKKKRIINN